MQNQTSEEPFNRTSEQKQAAQEMLAFIQECPTQYIHRGISGISFMPQSGFAQSWKAMAMKGSGKMKNGRSARAGLIM